MPHSEPITGPMFMRDLQSLLETQDFHLVWAWDKDRESYLGEIQRGCLANQIMISGLEIEDAISWEAVQASILKGVIEAFDSYREGD